jgi:hypothetical protein
MMEIQNKNKAISGQSTVEFTLTLILFLGFTFFFLRLALVFGFANYAHYATFMAARSYLSANARIEDQEQNARSVIIRTLKKSQAQPSVDRFPFMGRGVGGEFPPGASIKPPAQFQPKVRPFSWLQGVRYTFRSRLFLFPFQRGGEGTSPRNSLELTAESWLGKESTFEDCRVYLGTKNGIFDNGC